MDPLGKGESIITMYVVQRKYDAFKTVHKHLLLVNLTIVIYVWQVHVHIVIDVHETCMLPST